MMQNHRTGNVLDKKTYVKKAESVIKQLAEKTDRNGRPIPRITTSQIRNLLAMSADIYNEAIMSDEKLSDDINARIDYLRVRCVYEAGRTPAVHSFIDAARILQALQEIDGSRDNFILFNHYMEALVAYHRFYKGRD